MVIALAGVVVLIGEAVGLGHAGVSWRGDALVLGSAVTGGGVFVIGARLAHRYSVAAATMWSVILAGIVAVPATFMRTGIEPILAMPRTGWIAIVYLGAGSAVFAYLTWFVALRLGGVARISSFQFALPVVGVALGALFLGELVTWPLIAATAVIITGIALVQRG